MKEVIWTDERGFKHRSLLRDNDPDNLGSAGIPLDPPDLFHLDWDGLVRELHNLLVDKKLSTWEDVQRSGNGVSSSIQTVLKRPIIALYRHKEDK